MLLQNAAAILLQNPTVVTKYDIYYKLRQCTYVTSLKVTYNLKTMWTYMCIDVYVCMFVYIIYITSHENNCQIVLTKDSCRDK